MTKAFPFLIAEKSSFWTLDNSKLSYYYGSMKTKTSITLSQEILSMIDGYLEGEGNRSAFIELAVRTYMEILQKNKRDQRDLEIINSVSEKLNREAEDVLAYQVEFHS